MASFNALSITCTGKGGTYSAMYRVKQFLRGLRARVSADERAHVQKVLSARGYALFERMPTDAQRHSLEVYSTLVQSGEEQPDLLVASLLHDVGKAATEEGSVELGIWLRGPLVLAERVAPWLLEWLAADDPNRGWRYVIYVHRNHAEIGARWASAIECSELVYWLIAHHQDGCNYDLAPIGGATDQMDTSDERYRLLQKLQWADSQN